MQDLMNGKKVLVIIPAYNEEAKIAGVISDIRQTIDTDILVIDDGSSDNTAEVARNAGAEAISLPFNLGYGAALETGYIYAFNNGYNYVAQMDADGQHEPRCLWGLLEQIKKEEYDLIIGSRFLGNSDYTPSFSRKVGMVLFANLSSLLTGSKVTDSTSGFQAMNRKVLGFFVKGFYPSDYPDADVIILLHRVGFKISEHPVEMYSKKGAKSMHSGIIGPSYYIFKMALSILMIYLRKVPKL